MLTQPGSAYPSSIFSLEDANTDSDQFSYYSFGWLDNNESIRSQVGPFYIIDQLWAGSLHMIVVSNLVSPYDVLISC